MTHPGLLAAPGTRAMISVKEMYHMTYRGIDSSSQEAITLLYPTLLARTHPCHAERPGLHAVQFLGRPWEVLQTTSTRDRLSPMECEFLGRNRSRPTGLLMIALCSPTPLDIGACARHLPPTQQAPVCLTPAPVDTVAFLPFSRAPRLRRRRHDTSCPDIHIVQARGRPARASSATLVFEPGFRVKSNPIAAIWANFEVVRPCFLCSLRIPPCFETSGRARGIRRGRLH